MRILDILKINSLGVRYPQVGLYTSTYGTLKYMENIDPQRPPGHL
jgi:hypothetical protein